MVVQDVEHVIDTVADSMTNRETSPRRKTETFKIKTPSGEREFRRPQIKRTARVNGLILTRDEVRAFARLKARGRLLSTKGSTR